MRAAALPAVSVMMPVFNGARFIGDAVGSLLRQTFDDWELVVVDDGSTDGCGEVVARFRDPRIRVVRRDNGGEAAARNTALDVVRGDYVAFLDADDLFLPDHLRLLHGYLDSHQADIGAYGDGYYIDEQGRRLKRLSARRRGPFRGRVFDEVARGSDCLCPPLCIMLRRSPIEDQGLRFSETVGLGTDWDFFLRIADIGTFGYVDTPSCLYRLHSGNMTFNLGASARILGAARCRARAIRMTSFSNCPLDVRYNVFYDLLVNLLQGNGDQQDAVVGWPEFEALPRGEQGRLLRLMASRAIVRDRRQPFARTWLQKARRAAPSDWRTRVLLQVYAASPLLCQALLRWRAGGSNDPRMRRPFADLGGLEHSGNAW